MNPRGVYILCAVQYLLPVLIHAQSWTSAAVPGNVLNIRQVYANSTRDTIYCGGAIEVDETINFALTNPVMRYAQGRWDTLGVLRGLIHSMVLYRDTLIAGGEFLAASDLPCEGIAYYDGTQWHPYGDLERSVRRLRVLDNELYAVGGFDLADGQPAPGVAKRVGNSWQPVGWFNNQGSILDIAKFNENLVVIGNVDMDQGRGIAEWNGANWELLGPGILGGFSGEQCLTVYQDQLYVGGQISITAGNAGQNIMRWDGEQFHPLGQGIQWWAGNTTSIATVLNMIEHNGKLFVGGGFRAAGGVEAMGLATWDGSEWCGVHGDFQGAGGLWAMDFYQDTLFAACGAVFEGDSVNRAVKFIGQEYEQVCSGQVSVESNDLGPEISLHPNPTSTTIQVQVPFSGPTLLFVHNALGQEFRRKEVRHPLGTDLKIDVSDLVPGIYYVSLRSSTGLPYSLKFVVER
ncbi:MAG: T9SS type A sorting domain-containing protein [Flavobacteriales bacterium]|nr:T9SS type A sorting domain-containing protein [Flavobacteriales bacterium]